jgi:hypothetical protein
LWATFDGADVRATALSIADRIGVRYERARAHAGLGHALCGNNNLVEARLRWDRALRGFGELGCPKRTSS